MWSSFVSVCTYMVLPVQEGGVKSINFTPGGGIYRIFSHLAPALFKFPLIKPIRHIVICNLSEIGNWILENLRIEDIVIILLNKTGTWIQIQIFRVASPHSAVATGSHTERAVKHRETYINLTSGPLST